MPDLPAIRLHNAGKLYTKYEDQPLLATAALRFRTRSRRGKLWALRHVNLDVAPGECLGVIGRNGSGKSTMLQMLAGVTSPTEGRVAVRGRVAPLVAVGVGFHPELTGRENVYLNGTILGLSRKEIDLKFDDIVAFSEIADFIDTPVKFYSSGMYVRLGFSVAIQAEPDVLLIDEVLAVGDMAFQMKCFDRMMTIAGSGTTIVVVSHNLNAVRMMCQRTVLLHQGELRFDGRTDEAISRYHDILSEPRDFEDHMDKDDLPHEPGVCSIEGVDMLDAAGEPTSHIKAGDEVTVRIRAEFQQDVVDPVFTLALASETGVSVYNETSALNPLGRFIAGQKATCDVRMKARLNTGAYTAWATVISADLKCSYSKARPITFYVSGRPFVGGITDLGADFSTSDAAAVASDAAGSG
ncbi:MAG: ABC transporter ATP-binding protein [Candidatus Dormibacteraeota bacterium]|nr:ABC transporter ATP-binding protein [Candidatus Dormibacteraeota bacterium]